MAVTGSGVSSGSSARLRNRSLASSMFSKTSSSVAAVSLSASFVDELTFFDTSRWHAANWNNGGYFINGWHPNQLSFADGRLAITLQADTAGLSAEPAVSGEYRTNGFYRYGLYQARLMPRATPGTVTGFFTYVGPDSGNPHDEIDVEFKGDDTTKLYVNYWTNGVEHPTTINLGFDASAAYHNYAFRWSATGIEWFVDGLRVYSENGSRGPLPLTPGQLMFNHWGAIGTWPWSSDYVVSSTPSVARIERVSFTAETPATAVVVSVGALSGRAYVDALNWRAVASVTVRNASGLPVPGAVVTGGFTVGGTPLSCTTASNGVCSITGAKLKTSVARTTFSVSKIVGTNMTYDATKNAATSLVIARP